MKTIVNARIVSFVEEYPEGSKVFIDQGKILEISQAEDRGEVLDAAGKLLAPAFIDMHVHMREPGFEHKGDYESEGRALVAGGYTLALAMPNTKPTPDCPKHWHEVVARSKKSVADIEVIASVTEAEQGQQLNDLRALYQAGARYFSDDGMPLSESNMEKAMEILAELNAMLMVHEEDQALFETGAIHRGSVSEALGIDGMPSEAEWKMIERDIEILRRCGGRLHICHVSTKEGVDLIRRAKKEGLAITAEVTPHHLFSDHRECLRFGALAKVNPPLREEEDVQACWEGLKDGSLDIIATDHAPHDEASKERPLERASFGFTGSEFAFSLVNTACQKGGMSLREVLQRMSLMPAKIMGLRDRGDIAPGYRADLVLIDEEKDIVYLKENLKSKGKNSPFLGRILKGEILWTMKEGELLYDKVIGTDA